MDFHLTEIQDMLQDGARRFFASEFDAENALSLEASEDGFSKDIWEQMSSLGWSSVALPGAVGGSDLGVIELALIAEEMGRAGVGAPLIVSSGVATFSLKALMQNPQAKELQTKLAAGGIITMALIDAHRRDEWSTPTTVLRSEGSETVLVGKKFMVPFASAADMILVSAISQTGELALAAVSADAEGITLKRHHAISGDPSFQVTFEGVRITDDQILARGEDASTALNAGLEVGTVLAMAEAVGCCEGIIALTTEYAKVREQFGRAIGSFQAVAHPIADMRIQTNACRLLQREAALLLDRGRAATFEIASAKVFANDAIPKIALDAHRLHGAIGYSSEYSLQLLTRRAKAFSVSWGDNDREIGRAATALGLSNTQLETSS